MIRPFQRHIILVSHDESILKKYIILESSNDSIPKNYFSTKVQDIQIRTTIIQESSKDFLGDSFYLRKFNRFHSLLLLHPRKLQVVNSKELISTFKRINYEEAISSAQAEKIQFQRIIIRKVKKKQF